MYEESFNREHLQEIFNYHDWKALCDSNPQDVEFNKDFMRFNLKGFGIVEIKHINMETNIVGFQTMFPNKINVKMSIDKFCEKAISRVKGID